MTLPFKNSRKVVTNTGAVATIDVDFTAEASQYVKVYAGLPGVHLMVQGVDYTLTGVTPGSASFTVNITDPAAWDDYDVFAVSVEYTVEQPSDVDVGGPFGLRFENALDRLTLIMQSLADRVNRALKMPVTGVVGQDNSIAPIPGQIIGWNEDGSELISYPAVTQSTAEAIAAAAVATAAAEDADDSALAAGASATDAGDSATLAAQWATNPEDVPVTGGLFSAFHWYSKTLAIYTLIANTLAGWIHAATLKAAMIDADEFGYWDSVTGNLRKLTLANLVTSIFNGTRRVVNGWFEGDTFRVYKITTAFYAWFDVSLLTAARKLMLQDRDMMPGVVTLGTGSLSLAALHDFDIPGTVPSGFRRFTIILGGFSTNGTSIPILQLKAAGVAETTGYSGCASNTAVSAGTANSTGINLNVGTSAVTTYELEIVATLRAGNTWSIVVNGSSSTNVNIDSSGGKTLANVISGFRLTTVSGTDLIDAGGYAFYGEY